MSAQPRLWTADEDDLMRRQAQGEFSMHRLERAILSSRESIINRMRALGYEPIIQKRRGMRFPQTGVRDFPTPVAADVLNFCPSVGQDKLLQRLKDLYPDRRFEELDFTTKGRARRT